MIPCYPYVKPIKKRKRRKKEHPFSTVMVCIASGFSLGMINTYIHLFLYYGWSAMVPLVIFFAVFAANFACALTFLLFLSFNPTNNNPTND